MIRSKLCCEERQNEVWKDEHRNVLRKLVVEGGWVQKRLNDIGWSDEKNFRGRGKEGRHGRSTHCTTARAGRKSEARCKRNEEMGTKSKNIKEILEVAKKNHDASYE